jgi:outer membrane biogenesis lipoprotein LolB
MKKNILFLIVVALLLLSGCSSTWNGVKEDSSNAWKSTKETIHKATE